MVRDDFDTRKANNHKAMEKESPFLAEFMWIITKSVGGITGCRRFLPRTELCMADTASCTDTGA